MLSGKGVKKMETVCREALLELKISRIEPNPQQPRRRFEGEALRELADSIAHYGVLQPLTVRQVEGHYELVAGERRLRAARMAGLETVPCRLLADADEQLCGILALVENLQRRDLDFVDEARGIRRLIERYGLTEAQAARRIGKSQSAVANKLRLLKLPEDVLDGLRRAGLTERHGRALLKLPENSLRREALAAVAERGMSVQQTERYVDELLKKQEPSGAGMTRFVLKDVRVFLNSLQHAVELMRQGGVEVGVKKEESEEELTVTVHIKR